jgi:DNA-binding PadR family transcriptional regulator
MPRHHHHDGAPRDDALRVRKFSSEDLQIMLLSLLEEGASHGYDLIRALEQRSEGAYSPSPGMVYPALTYIQDLGLADVTVDGNKKSYRLSGAGLERLAAVRGRAAQLFAALLHLARKTQYLRGAMAGEAADSAWLPQFVEARLALKHALMMKSGASHEEQRRIVAILERAAVDIKNA